MVRGRPEPNPGRPHLSHVTHRRRRHVCLRSQKADSEHFGDAGRRLHRDSAFTKLLLSGSLIGVSLPTFLIGIVLILIFGAVFRVLPTFGRGEVVDLGFWSTGLLTWSGIKALILPTVTLAVFQLTLIMRLVRAEMLEVLRADFIKFGRARGLSRSFAALGTNTPRALSLPSPLPIIELIDFRS